MVSSRPSKTIAFGRQADELANCRQANTDQPTLHNTYELTQWLVRVGANAQPMPNQRPLLHGGVGRSLVTHNRKDSATLAVVSDGRFLVRVDYELEQFFPVVERLTSPAARIPHLLPRLPTILRRCAQAAHGTALSRISDKPTALCVQAGRGATLLRVSRGMRRTRRGRDVPKEI